MNEANWSGTADEIEDTSGNENHGIAMGGATTDTGGLLNRGGLFDGSNDWIDCGADASLNLTSAITVETWVKPQFAQEVCFPGGGNDGNVGIAAKVTSNTGSTTWSWQLRYGSPDACCLGIQLNTVAYGAQWATANGALTTGVWSHVAFTFDGTVIKFYVNGVLTDTNTLAGATTIESNLNKLLIYSDGWSESTGYWKGVVDEFRVYNRALTETELLGIRNHGDGTELLFGNYLTSASPSASPSTAPSGATLYRWTGLAWVKALLQVYIP